MARSFRSGYRGPMIHIRLDEQTHKQLRILVAHRDTTIQQLVNDLVRREVERSVKQKKQKQE
jgi:hypothetical protein